MRTTFDDFSTPDTSTIADKIAVMKAAIEGRAIEAKIKGCGPHKWHHCPKPHWNWEEIDYRVAPTSPAPPAPRYRPWTLYEVPVGAIVRPKGYKRRTLIVDVNMVSPDDISISIGRDDNSRTPRQMLDHWMLEDGTPCGTLEGGEK